MKKDIILVGGGGHCKSVIDVAEMAGYNILGVLDIKERIGEKILSTYIIGCDDDIQKFVDKASFLVTVGFIKDPTIRNKLFDKIKNNGGTLATIVASNASISKHATIGEGTIVMNSAIINAEASIGKNCIINTCANIEHETSIGNNCHISTGAMINGGCNIGDNVFVGSQSVMAQCVSIVEGTIIGAGSFVNKNIDKAGVYAGNPISFIRTV